MYSSAFFHFSFPWIVIYKYTRTGSPEYLVLAFFVVVVGRRQYKGVEVGQGRKT